MGHIRRRDPRSDQERSSRLIGDLRFLRRSCQGLRQRRLPPLRHQSYPQFFLRSRLEQFVFRFRIAG
ncbi:hypothetical protein LINGRAHAP2_LOCUS23861 [Linum grandiflorum]